MALNLRSVVHPKFTTHFRQSLRTTARGKIIVSRITADPTGTVNWTPFDANPANRQPQSPHTDEIIYVGRARIQPNVDWRARRQNWRDEAVVDHAYRIELPFKGNELTASGGVADLGGGVTPNLEMNDVIRCTDASNPQLLTYIFIVRNPVPSTTSWSHVVLCDVNVDLEVEAV